VRRRERQKSGQYDPPDPEEHAPTHRVHGNHLCPLVVIGRSLISVGPPLPRLPIRCSACPGVAHGYAERVPSDFAVARHTSSCSRFVNAARVQAP